MSISAAIDEIVTSTMRSNNDEAQAEGENGENETPLQSAGGGARRPGARLVTDMLDADEEVPSNRTWSGPRGTQRKLHKMIDAAKADELTEKFRLAGQEFDVKRMEDLGHADTDHTWMWSLRQSKQENLPTEEFVTCMRLRLGVPLMEDDRTCVYCNDVVMDMHGHHCHVCAGAESTRGHTAVKDVVLDLAIKADPAAESEPVFLISSRPGLCPADIPSAGAVQGTLVALDVGVTAPSLADGNTDCTAHYRQAKLDKYRRYLPELEAQGVQYRPIIWSSWGRPHPDSTASLKALAARAARRRGLTSGRDIHKQTAAKVGLAIQRR